MMTQEQFVYWLRGFLSGKDYICSKDVDLLKEELSKVNVVTFSNPTITPPTNPPWGPTYWGTTGGTTVVQATADNQIPGSSRDGPKDHSTMPCTTGSMLTPNSSIPCATGTTVSDGHLSTILVATMPTFTSQNEKR